MYKANDSVLIKQFRKIWEYHFSTCKWKMMYLDELTYFYI